MVPRSFLFVFHAGSSGQGSNNYRNSSIRKKRLVRPVFPDYLSVSYDYYQTESCIWCILFVNVKYFLIGKTKYFAEKCMYAFMCNPECSFKKLWSNLILLYCLRLFIIIKNFGSKNIYRYCNLHKVKFKKFLSINYSTDFLWVFCNTQIRRRFAVFIINFEHILQLFLVFLLLTLNKYILIVKQACLAETL